jgi:hypothetical protein
VIDEYGANGGMIFAGETEELEENVPKLNKIHTEH